MSIQTNRAVVRSKTVMTAAALGATLMLAACSGGADGAPAAEGNGDSGDQSGQAAVYQFDEAKTDDGTPFMATDLPVTVQLSDELVEAAPSGTQLTVDHFRLNATAFDTGSCRLDVEVAYANDGANVLSAPRDRGRNAHEYVMAALTLNRQYTDVIVADALPNDEDLENNQTYMTEDFTGMTFVDSCSEDVDDRFIPLAFAYPDDEGDLEEFAVADVSVVRGSQSSSDGATVMIIGDTEADLTPAGAWVSDSED